jgi:hypothetical protein
MMDNTPRVFVGRASFWLPGPLGGRCLRALSEELRAIPGVTQVVADAVTGTLSVTVDRPVDREAVAGRLGARGCGEGVRMFGACPRDCLTIDDPPGGRPK